MNPILLTTILAKLATEQPGAAELNRLLSQLPDNERAQIYEEILKANPSTDLSELIQSKNTVGYGTIDADKILNTPFDEPLWIVEGILPIGLAICAGKAKIGKSWLMLQLSLSVSMGTNFLNRQVCQGQVLYISLEDSPRRLKTRMLQQKWPNGTKVEFLDEISFRTKIVALSDKGLARLEEIIRQKKYKLIIIDTISRAKSINQNNVQDVTDMLSPLHELAHKYNCAIVLVDHHKKGVKTDSDVITDILGSSAKGAVVDTVFGLYRVGGSNRAKLQVTGRDVEEVTLAIIRNNDTGTWVLDSNETTIGYQLSLHEETVVEKLEASGPVSVTELASEISQDKGNLYRSLQHLSYRGKVRQRKDKKWEVTEKH